MSGDVEKLERIKMAIAKEGLTLSEVLTLSAKKYTKLLNFSTDVQDKYKCMFEKIDSGKCSQKDKGILLEELMYTLFHRGYSSLLVCGKNYRTSTNEIDLRISWTEEAKYQRFTEIYNCFGSSFLCECKNYDKKVDVTYVGKFYSLLATTDTNLGIMISWNGVTGRSPWSDASGLIKKIALRENRYIVVINRNDLYQIYLGKTNIFALIDEKYNSLKEDISYEQLVTAHEAQGNI